MMNDTLVCPCALAAAGTGYGYSQFFRSEWPSVEPDKALRTMPFRYGGKTHENNGKTDRSQ